MTRTTKIAIVYYSTYGHVAALADAIVEGAKKIANIEINIYQIKETLTDEILTKMHAPPKKEHPEITPDILKEQDGVLWGVPTRFGIMPAQVKTFIDSCGQLWAAGALQHKFAGTFVSSNTQHGGQETTHMTMLTTFAHFGVIYVPLGYSNPHLNLDDAVLGGSPWGASVVAGSNGRLQPNEKELDIAKTQGENFAKVVSQYVNGAPAA
jgi:NAD(P)H dehydrogenase (quinone)